MKQIAILAAAIGLTGGLAGAQIVRAGVFDSRAVVVAYYRSPQWAESLTAKRAEQAAARIANDAAKARKPKHGGRASRNSRTGSLQGKPRSRTFSRRSRPLCATSPSAPV